MSINLTSHHHLQPLRQQVKAKTFGRSKVESCSVDVSRCSFHLRNSFSAADIFLLSHLFISLTKLHSNAHPSELTVWARVCVNTRATARKQHWVGERGYERGRSVCSTCMDQRNWTAGTDGQWESAWEEHAAQPNTHMHIKHRAKFSRVHFGINPQIPALKEYTERLIEKLFYG